MTSQHGRACDIFGLVFVLVYRGQIFSVMELREYARVYFKVYRFKEEILCAKLVARMSSYIPSG